MTQSSPYGLYFFLFLPFLPCRVSIVKGRSSCTPLSISVCSGQFQYSSAHGKVSPSTSTLSVNSKSSGRSQPSTTSFPSFCLACLFHSPRRQDPLSNSLPLACQLGCTSPLMRHCAVWCFRNELLVWCSIDKNDLLSVLLLFEKDRAIFSIMLVSFVGTTSWNTQT